MKKLSIAFLCLLSTLAVAQDTQESSEPLTSKRGIPILPETGEWALGIDATPFLEYLGNFLHGDDYNYAPTFNSNGQNATLMGKYMTSPTTAYRVRLALNRNSGSLKNTVDDDEDADEEVEDKITVSETNIFLGVGLEKRRGKGRLQGIYGAEVGVGLMSGGAKYNYGNALNDDNNNATFTVFDYSNPSNIDVDFVDFDNSRVTKFKEGSSISFGVNGFIGVEYFIAPKVSLGGEVGYGINISTAPKGKVTTETWDFVDDELDTETSESFSGPSGFNFGTRPSGNIYLIFYF